MDIHISDLKVGDIAYEYDSLCGSLQFRVDTPVVFEGDQWTFTGTTADGRTINYLSTKGYECYGPRFNEYPVYGPVTSFPEVEDAAA